MKFSIVVGYWTSHIRQMNIINIFIEHWYILNNMYLKCQYKRNDLDVDLYPSLLTPDLATAWYIYLDSIIPKSNNRSSLLFGNEGLIYRVTYRDVTTEREVIPWSDIPALPELKSLVDNITNQTSTVCVIQRYNDGKVGINPHRDKEMVFGTRIAGLSLGAKRTLQLTRAHHEPVSISLPSGSLYVMNPPTNQKWLHSIVKEPKIKDTRFSLTFRDYRG